MLTPGFGTSTGNPAHPFLRAPASAGSAALLFAVTSSSWTCLRESRISAEMRHVPRSGAGATTMAGMLSCASSHGDVEKRCHKRLPSYKNRFGRPREQEMAARTETDHAMIRNTARKLLRRTPGFQAGVRARAQRKRRDNRIGCSIGRSAVHPRWAAMTGVQIQLGRITNMCGGKELGGI